MKKLLIVCEEKTRPYGDFLAQLISLQDDDNDQIIGTKDGEVAAQVWTEKEYISNAVQISSEQYILFIGNSKLFKEKRLHMQQKYSEYGMNYGWLGKQSTLFVDKTVNTNDYPKFLKYTNEIQLNLKDLLGRRKFIKSKSTKIEKNENFLIFPVNAITESLMNETIQSINAFTIATSKKRIGEQEYSCLILVFYLKGLSEFLNLNK